MNSIEARIKSNKVKSKNELKNILFFIKLEVDKGLNNYYEFKKLHENVLFNLSRLGYKIKKFNLIQRIFLDYKYRISW